MKLQNVKGSMDFLPEEQLVRNKVISTLSNTFLEYGYLPVETTTLCYYDLLASKYAGGAEILKEVYKLKDQGERDLALRYDLTVPCFSLKRPSQIAMYRLSSSAQAANLFFASTRTPVVSLSSL